MIFSLVARHPPDYSSRHLCTMSLFRGYASSNQIHLLFGIFVQKWVKNTLKSTLKDWVWFGHGLVVILGQP